MIYATAADKMQWITEIVQARTANEMIGVVNKIWEDGYRSAEAEVTYSITPEK